MLSLAISPENIKQGRKDQNHAMAANKATLKYRATYMKRTVAYRRWLRSKPSIWSRWGRAESS